MPTALGIITAAQPVGYLEYPCPAHPVGCIQGIEPFRSTPKGRYGTLLNSIEHPGIHIALHFEYGLQEIGISQEHPDTPAREVKRLTERIQLQYISLSVGNFKNTQGATAQYKTIRVVIDQEDLVSPRKANQFQELLAAWLLHR